MHLRVRRSRSGAQSGSTSACKPRRRTTRFASARPRSKRCPYTPRPEGISYGKDPSCINLYHSQRPGRACGGFCAVRHLFLVHTVRVLAGAPAISSLCDSGPAISSRLRARCIWCATAPASILAQHQQKTSSKAVHSITPVTHPFCSPFCFPVVRLLFLLRASQDASVCKRLVQHKCLKQPVCPAWPSSLASNGWDSISYMHMISDGTAGPVQSHSKERRQGGQMPWLAGHRFQVLQHAVYTHSYIQRA